MSSTSVTYKPLQFPDEIRLLVLQPARPGYDQPIKWRIKHERLCHKPQYEALSYVWDLGSAGGMKSFSRKTTPTNLSLALQHLRKQAEPDGRVLWIDALCINQKDVKERNHQVTQMGLIYSQAESVIVWLGVGNSATGSAINLLSTQTDTTYTYRKPFDTSPWITLLNLMAVRALCRQKYWTRLWIIQEVLLAAAIDIQWGDEMCQWSQLCWFLSSIDTDWLSKVDEEENHFDLKASIIEEIRSSTAARLCNDWVDRQVRMRSTLDADPVFSPLIALCSKYGGANCEDSRDKIFGLHSLAESCCRAEVSVDYSFSLPEIYRRVLEHCMQRHFRWDSVISASQEFHEKLRISHSQCTRVAGGKFDIVTEAVGYITSIISYVSPAGFEDKGGHWPKGGFRPRSLSLNCRERLLKINNLHKTYGAAKFRSQCVSRDYELAVAFERNSGWRDAFGPFSAGGRKQWRSPASSHRLYMPRREAHQSREALNRILLDARSVTSENPTANTSIALCESGFICFVPSEARPGDFVCQFPQSNISIIISAAEERLVGRAVNFLSDPHDKPFTVFDDPIDQRALKEDGREITLRLDLPTLQVITASSALTHRKGSKVTTGA